MIRPAFLLIALIVLATASPTFARRTSTPIPATESPALQAVRSALDRDDLAAAAELPAEPADHGDPDALFALGFLHDVGAGAPIDGTTSLRLLKAASEKGHVIATRYLAWKYRTGFLLAPDHTEAERYAAKIPTDRSAQASLIPEK